MQTALLPGEVGSYANVTGYAKGINGLLIDFAGMPPGQLSADDFEFRAGTSGDPATWPVAPTPTAVAPVPGNYAPLRYERPGPAMRIYQLRDCS